MLLYLARSRRQNSTFCSTMIAPYRAAPTLFDTIDALLLLGAAVLSTRSIVALSSAVEFLSTAINRGMKIAVITKRTNNPIIKATMMFCVSIFLRAPSTYSDQLSTFGSQLVSSRIALFHCSSRKTSSQRAASPDILKKLPLIDDDKEEDDECNQKNQNRNDCFCREVCLFVRDPR